jgi:chromosome partitioning protein
VWFRRGRFVVVSPGLQPSWLLSGRNSTYPDVQISWASSAGAEICILDTPPKAENSSLAAARAADLVLVPVQPARLDLDALKETADILALAKTPALVVISRAPPMPNSRVEAQTRDVIQNGYELKAATTVLHNRIAFQHAMTLGQGVIEYEPTGAAANEIRALMCEVSDVLDL